jgi:2',3'-cyclic-nucleotide 2'-phosphodiesterase (5'-nucleotidase family)
MKTHIWLLALAAAAVLCAWSVSAEVSSQPASAPASTAASQTARLVVLHINDVHGQTQGTAQRGGYARLATVVDDVRTRHRGQASVLLLHAGDEMSRGDELTERTAGEANFAVLNHLKLDAFTPGNGDYYESPSTLAARIAQAQFPVLTANVTAADGKCLARRYVIIDAAPLRVAVLGLCFIKDYSVSMHDVRLGDPVQCAKELVPALRKQADVVVALTHIGLDEDLVLAKQVPGIDLIVGGHSHSLLPKGRAVKNSQGEDVLVVQAGQQLGQLGQVELVAQRQGDSWRITSASASMLPLDDKVQQDAQVKALLARLAERASSRPAAVAP